MSRATDALLATVGFRSVGDAANDEVGSEARSQSDPAGVELTTWIDALALTLAAGLRVGATGLDRVAVRPPLSHVDDLGDVSGAEVGSGLGDADVLDVDEVASLLKIGRNAVYESVGRGELPHRRIGKQIRFSRQAIMRWFDSWSSQGAREGK